MFRWCVLEFFEDSYLRSASKSQLPHSSRTSTPSTSVVFYDPDTYIFYRETLMEPIGGVNGVLKIPGLIAKSSSPFE